MSAGGRGETALTQLDYSLALKHNERPYNLESPCIAVEDEDMARKDPPRGREDGSGPPHDPQWTSLARLQKITDIAVLTKIGHVYGGTGGMAHAWRR